MDKDKLYNLSVALTANVIITIVVWTFLQDIGNLIWKFSFYMVGK